MPEEEGAEDMGTGWVAGCSAALGLSLREVFGNSWILFLKW